MRRRALLAVALALHRAGARAGATHVVAPGDSLTAALHRAGDGDEIQLLAGEHLGQVGVIAHRRLRLRGVGGRVVLHAAGRYAEGKALLVVRGGDVQIEDIEFRGSRVPDGNGAGIRFERGRLTVRRCGFFDNQMGLLTSNFPDSELEVHDSQFGQAPAGGTSLPHLLYVGSIGRLVLRGSRLGGGSRGHLVKSRARLNLVHYNQLVDGPGGGASYELEFPNGGVAVVVGNVIGQSSGSDNLTLLAFGAEGSDERAQALYLVNNTFVAEGPRPALFVRVHASRLAREVEMRVANNLFVGLGEVDAALASASAGNQFAPLSELPSTADANYRLPRDSRLAGSGVEPGQAGGWPLAPEAEFVSPAGTRPIAPRQRWSPGAYQD